AGPDAGPHGADAGGCQPGLCAPGDGGVCIWDYDGGGPVPSCIAQICVNECGGGRSCTVEDGGRCLACGGSTRCAMDACTPRQLCRFTVEGGGACVGLLDNGS